MRGALAEAWAATLALGSLAGFFAAGGFASEDSPETLLQRCHQIDDVAAIWFLRLADIDTFALQLRIDHRPKSCLVAILQVGRIIRRGLPIDQLLGELRPSLDRS